MRLLVTGVTGQVVTALAERARAHGHPVIALGRPDLDLATVSQDDVIRAIDRYDPDLIVSAAAFTAVDRAEAEAELAFRINAGAAGMLAAGAAHRGKPLIHLSTDYVFPGDKLAPYVETDPTGPTGVYGASKLAGETAVLAAHEDVAVLRTAWVYSATGANFVKTMLRLAGERDDVRVVADQQGNPTSACDIADGILVIASNMLGSADPDLRGVFHMTGTGESNWASFAEAIFAESFRVGGPSARVVPISTAEYPTAARRPANSRLDCSKLAAVHGVRLPDWRSSLGAVVERLINPSGPSKAPAGDQEA